VQFPAQRSPVRTSYSQLSVLHVTPSRCLDRSRNSQLQWKHGRRLVGRLICYVVSRMCGRLRIFGMLAMICVAGGRVWKVLCLLSSCFCVHESACIRHDGISAVVDLLWVSI
jgi:predicted DNA repair protein MutK